MIKNTKQAWEIGQVVKVGFVAGLTIVAKVPTPGAPDAYVLVRGESVYSFVPHNGLTKISQDDARVMVASAKRVAAANEAKATAAASAAIKFAQFTAELISI